MAYDDPISILIICGFILTVITFFVVIFMCLFSACKSCCLGILELIRRKDTISLKFFKEINKNGTYTIEKKTKDHVKDDKNIELDVKSESSPADFIAPDVNMDSIANRLKSLEEKKSKLVSGTKGGQFVENIADNLIHNTLGNGPVAQFVEGISDKIIDNVEHIDIQKNISDVVNVVTNAITGKEEPKTEVGKKIDSVSENIIQNTVGLNTVVGKTVDNVVDAGIMVVENIAEKQKEK